MPRLIKMDLLKPLIKHFTYNYFLKRDGVDLSKYTDALNKSQYLSEDELKDSQFKKLKELLNSCFANNRYYKSKFSAISFHPDDFKSLDDIKKLPILTKDDIRNNQDTLFSNGFSPENSIYKRTGGSTGIPLKLYVDPKAAAFKKAAVMRHNSWANQVPGVKTASIWGDTDKKLSFKENLRNKLSERIFYLDTLKFNPEHLNIFIDQIYKEKPEILFGHAHSVFRFAEYVRDNDFRGIKFDGIITTAMVLSESERKTIETVFASPVFNRYGCEELSIISSECEAHDGMHIFAEGLYVELIGEKVNHPKKLIITDLLNIAMPLIRYEIGDFAIEATGKCACGRTLPRLAEVAGRTADFLYRPDKEPVFGISILDTFVIHIPGIKQLQIVQDSYDHLDFYLVKDQHSFSESTLEKLKQNIIDIFSPEMNYTVHYVKEIKQTERGKFRFSICNIDKGDQK